MKNYQNAYLISLSYDGSNYHGWVKQKNQPLTIQSVLEKSLTVVIKTTDFYVLGSSKTDRGVHAFDQKVLLKVNFEIKNLAAFQDGLNKVLPDDLYIREINSVEQNFNLKAVKQKVYEYVLNDGAYDVFDQRFTTQIKHQKITENELKTILELFVGQHDFFLFSGLSEKEKGQFQTVRVIDEILVERIDSKVHITFKAPGFLRYQIRMIIGASLICLTNPSRLNKAQISEKLTGIGLKAPFLAPPNGLILKKVIY